VTLAELDLYVGKVYSVETDADVFDWASRNGYCVNLMITGMTNPDDNDKRLNVWADPTNSFVTGFSIG